MRQIKFLILFISIIFLKIDSKGQIAKFSKIEYASFDVNSYRTPEKNKAFIAVYSEIDSNGLVKINRNDYYKNKNTFSSYKLSARQLAEVASVFNLNKNLKSFVKEYKFKDGDEFFAGSYDFFSINYKDGTRDSICTIQPFMKPNFEKVYIMFKDIYYGDKKKKSIPPFDHSKQFVASLYDSYLKANLLPKIQNPPSFKIGN